jgi:hypothetical protein
VSGVNVTICDGKYTVIQEPTGGTRVLRYGEEWRDVTGDNVIGGLAWELQESRKRIKRLEDCIETAWGIIANVSGGDWTRQKPHWQEAVVQWRDNDFHPIMKELSERKAKEANP